jgi:hypothetical protein
LPSKWLRGEKTENKNKIKKIATQWNSGNICDEKIRLVEPSLAI